MYNRERRRRQETYLRHTIRHTSFQAVRHNNNIRSTIHNRVNVTNRQSRAQVVFSNTTCPQVKRTLCRHLHVIHVTNQVGARVAMRHTGQNIQQAIRNRHTSSKYRVSVSTNDLRLHTPYKYQLPRLTSVRYTLLNNQERNVRPNPLRVLSRAALLVNKRRRLIITQDVQLRHKYNNHSPNNPQVPITSSWSQAGVPIHSRIVRQ